MTKTNKVKSIRGISKGLVGEVLSTRGTELKVRFSELPKAISVRFLSIDDVVAV